MRDQAEENMREKGGQRGQQQPGKSQPGKSQPGKSQPGKSQPGKSQSGKPQSERGRQGTRDMQDPEREMHDRMDQDYDA
ncbi:hypothetical protein ACWEKM_26635 [Streptomyces sp. NPDC004752]